MISVTLKPYPTQWFLGQYLAIFHLDGDLYMKSTLVYDSRISYQKCCEKAGCMLSIYRNIIFNVTSAMSLQHIISKPNNEFWIAMYLVTGCVAPKKTTNNCMWLLTLLVMLYNFSCTYIYTYAWSAEFY